MTRRATLLLAAAVAVALAVGFGWVRPDDAAGVAWLFAFVLVAGLGAGGLALLAIGHLLGEEWLAPVRSELESAALTLPLAAVLAVPLAGNLDALYPWVAPGGVAGLPAPRAAWLEPGLVLWRGGACLALWTALALMLAREGEHPRAGALALVLLVPSLSLAGIDWVMSRDPRFWSALFGLAFAMSQLLAALALAILVSILRREHPSPERLGSLERGLLALALLTLWLWFMQYLIVWLANLPDDASWYLARTEGGWRWLILGVVLPTLALAVVILIPPGAGRFTIALGSILLLASHAAHMLWLLGPAGWGDAGWMDLGVLGGIAAAWALWFGVALAARPGDLEREEGEREEAERAAAAR